MKKLALTLTVVAVMLIPTLLLAQPPRPRPGQMHQVRPHPAPAPARPTMHVHAPARPAVIHTQPGHLQHRPPVVVRPHHPTVYHAPVVHPGVVVASPAVVPYNYYSPYYLPYYSPVSSGFSLTVGGRNGVFSIGTGY